MEYKRITAELVKGDDGEETGEVLVRFGTSGVLDLDGDVIEKGAIGVQAVKISAFGHASWMGALPVGKGVTREEGEQQLADLKFFMDTTHGVDHFRTVKGLGELGEWSYGFDIKEERAPTEDERRAGIRRVLKKLAVFEVSPVLRGAGIDTATLEAKCTDCEVKRKDAAAEELEAARGKAAGDEGTEQLADEEREAAELKAAVQTELGKATLLMEKVDRRLSA